ncbi:MAG: hypothetical protein ACOCV1_00765 [Bacillota bacterium]
MKKVKNKKLYGILKSFDEVKIPLGPCCYCYEFKKGKIDPEKCNCPYYIECSSDNICGYCLVTGYDVTDQEKVCKYNWENDPVFEQWYNKNFAFSK